MLQNYPERPATRALCRWQQLPAAKPCCRQPQQRLQGARHAPQVKEIFKALHPFATQASRPGGGQAAHAALQGALAVAADTARLCAELEAEAEAAARGLAAVAKRASQRQRAGQWAVTDQDTDVQGGTTASFLLSLDSRACTSRG